jgi:hypothetical protein
LSWSMIPCRSSLFTRSLKVQLCPRNQVQCV